MGKVIKRAEDLGEEELVDVMAIFKVNIARQASLQLERERLRVQTERRFHSRTSKKAGVLKKRGLLGRRTLYLVEDTSPKS